MRHVLLLVAATTTSLLTAQNPCGTTGNPPPAVLETTFDATHYVGAPTPSPGNGAALICDLVVDAAISISQIDVHLYNTGSPNPNLIGQLTTLEVYTIAGGWTPAVTGTQSAWTLAGTGSLLIQDFGVPSPATFTTPVALTPGTTGVIMRLVPVGATYVHPLVTLPSFAPGIPLTYSDQFVTLQNANVIRDLWASGTGAQLVINCNIHYTAAAGSAFSIEYGAGCYFEPFSFYEQFPNSGTFDLSDFMVQMIFGANSYTVIGVPGTPTLFAQGTGAAATGTETGSYNVTAIPPAISNTGLGTPTEWDDAFSATITLPFTIQAPNGISTNQIVIHSNGGLFLDPTGLAAGNAAAFYGAVTTMLGGNPYLAGFFCDLDPSAGGAIYYDLDPSGQTVYITYDQMPVWNGTAISTFQIVLHSSSTVEYRYLTCDYHNLSSADCLVGFTPGNGASNPGSIDLSARLAAGVLITGDGSDPLHIGLDARPVLGTTPNVVTSNIKSGTLAGALILGFGFQNPGMDLSGFGMAGCSLYIGFAPTPSLLVFIVSGATQNNPLGIPNNPSLSGLQLFAQSAAFTTGNNPAGMWASDGVCINLNAQ